ncbi:MAG: dTMP kinase [Acidobacteriaceae bacterium]|jgi:dTMP kinase|nr:dTMP kinase [Acidobacteriaceae bacterium]
MTRGERGTWRGALIAFEGLDQSGKQTQAELLREALAADGREVRFLSFPEYDTAIGQEIRKGLDGARDYAADTMQLLYIANRYERKSDILAWLDAGLVIVCDRYLASSVAYGEAFGLDARWLLETQRFLPKPTLTILLDIAPETAVGRKSTDRDRYERDLALQHRVRDSYTRLAASSPDWVAMDGERPKVVVAADVLSAVTSALARLSARAPH